MSRNTKGIIGWFFLTLMLSAVITEIAMVIREIYQRRNYPYNAFEWDDVIRYTSVIVIAQAIQLLIIFLIKGGV